MSTYFDWSDSARRYQNLRQFRKLFLWHRDTRTYHLSTHRDHAVNFEQFRRLLLLDQTCHICVANSGYFSLNNKGKHSSGIGHKSSPLIQHIGHIFLNGGYVWEYRLAKCPSLKYSINLLFGMLQTRLTT